MRMMLALAGGRTKPLRAVTNDQHSPLINESWNL